jgi:hypothetical protein
MIFLPQNADAAWNRVVVGDGLIRPRAEAPTASLL